MQVISAYSREDAVNDGVLFPVDPKVCASIGFRGTMYMSSGLKTAIEEEALENLRKSRNVLNDENLKKMATQVTEVVLLFANIAVFAESKNKGSNLAKFQWESGAGIQDCYITVEKNDKEGVVWTVMLTSDY